MSVQYISCSSICLGMSVAALVMAEYGVTSFFGDWSPTHETAIALGVLSVAFSNIGRYFQFQSSSMKE